MFPDDSLQSIIEPDPWWVKNTNQKICRGALIFAFTPHIDQVPYAFEPIGRTIATEHLNADVHVTPLKVQQPLKQVSLPVAAMPTYENEVWAAYRAKKRPCIVFGTETVMIGKDLTRGKPNHATAPTYLVAPFYGAIQNTKRSGYSSLFIERVRHCEYPQFHWDILPIPGGVESILRLDHLQPIGAHHEAYKLCEYKLSDSAMDLLDDMLRWLVWGGVPENSSLITYRQIIEEFITQ